MRFAAWAASPRATASLTNKQVCWTNADTPPRQGGQWRVLQPQGEWRPVGHWGTTPCRQPEAGRAGHPTRGLGQTVPPSEKPLPSPEAPPGGAAIPHRALGGGRASRLLPQWDPTPSPSPTAAVHTGTLPRSSHHITPVRLMAVSAT